MQRLLVLIASGLVFAAACGDDGGADGGLADAASDAPVDAGRDAGRDAGPMCAMACTGLDLCCDTPSGPLCVDTIANPDHCGDCGVVCAEGRGTECARSACQCGRVEGGCAGTPVSWCCPPRMAGDMPYCANLMTDGRDCGSCDNDCELSQASACSAGACVCGDERRACEGTPEDTCCADSVGVSACRDTTTDVFHCGACGRRCLLDERCEGGTCTRGTSCAAPCSGLDVCCDGVCCNRVLCDRGECGVDGGT